MRRGTLRGGYVLEEGKASCYSSTPSKEAKQNKQKIKASIDVSHKFFGGVDENAQGKCLTAELISMGRVILKCFLMSLKAFKDKLVMFHAISKH